MPTWDETREHLRAKYKLMKDEPTWVGLGFGFKAKDREVTQRVHIEKHTIADMPAVMIVADVVEATRVPHEAALKRNMTFAIGGIAIHEGRYLVRVALPLANIEWSTLETVLEYIAREAARLRDTVPGN